MDVSIALIGPTGAGKSALAAAAALEAGGQRWFRSDSVDAWTMQWRGRSLNLLDPSESGRRIALWGADVAIFVMSPLQGLDAATGELWDRCAGMPKVVVMTHLDAPGADFDEGIAICERVLQADGLLPLVHPLLDDEDRVAGYADLISLTLVDCVMGVERPPERIHLDLLAAGHAAIEEQVASRGSDEQFQRYLAEGALPEVELRSSVAAMTDAAILHPVLGHALQPPGYGSAYLLDVLAQCVGGAAPPVEEAGGFAAVPLGGGDAMVAQILGSATDGTKLARVRSGRIVEGDEIVRVTGEIGAASPCRVSQVTRPSPTNRLLALKVDADPWDTLCEPGRPVRVLDWPEA